MTSHADSEKAETDDANDDTKQQPEPARTDHPTGDEQAAANAAAEPAG